MTPDVGSDSPGTPPPGRLGAGGDHRADGAVRGVGRPRLRRRHLRSDPLRVGQHYRHRSSHRRSGQAQRCSSEHRPSSSSRVPHRIRLDRRPRRGGDRSGPPRAPSHRARTGCVESSSSPLTVGPFSSGTPVRPHLPQRPGSRRNVRKKSLIFQAFLRRRYWLGAPLRQMWTLCHPDESGYAAETPQAPSGGRPLTLVPHVSTATRAKGPLLARRGQGVSRVHRHARKGAAGRGGGRPRPPPRPAPATPGGGPGGPPPRANGGGGPCGEPPPRPAARTRESTWRASFAPTPPRPMIARWSSSVRMTGGVGATTRVASAPPGLLSRIGASSTTTRTRLRGPPSTPLQLPLRIHRCR